MHDYVPDSTLTAHGLRRATCTTCGTTIIIATGQPDGTCPTHTPRPTPPPFPHYPPSSNTAAINAINPDLTAHCMRPRCPHPTLALTSMQPDEIVLAYEFHDHVHHHPDGWYIGGPGGSNGDVCNPCAGWNGKEKKPLTDGPRHDLCLHGKTEWRGGDCECTHTKPHMRGIKPGQPVDTERVRAARARLAANRAAADVAPAITAPTVADYYQSSLIDPEEDTDA